MSIARSRLSLYALFFACASLHGMAVFGQSTVHLRGGSGQIVASEVTASVSGLRITTSNGPQVLPWHRIRRVEGDGAATARPYAEASEDAWRGLSRLRRGDPVAAEAPLERAYQVLGLGQTSATAAAIAEGLLQCRLARGEIVGVFEPWLTLLACEASGSWSADSADGLLDTHTGLLPVLSPSLFAGLPHRMDSIAHEDAPQSGRAVTLVSLYRVAWLFEHGGEVELRQPDDSSRGVLFLHSIVAARVDDETGRRIARRFLWDVLQDERVDWQDAWAEAGLGYSLLREGAGSELEAVAHLLAVPARFGSAYPLLAGVCLAEAARVMDSMGRQEDAGVLARELAREFPGHPSIERPDIQRLVQQQLDSVQRGSSTSEDELQQ